MNKENLKKLIVNIVNELDEVPGKGYRLAHIGLRLRKEGFDHREYGYLKLSEFFKSLEPYVKVNVDASLHPPVYYIEINKNEDESTSQNNTSSEDLKEIHKVVEFKKFDSKEAKKSFLKFMLVTVFIVIPLLMTVLFFALSQENKETSFKPELQDDLLAAIDNNADIETVKHLYENYPREYNFWYPIRENQGLPITTSLESVLMTIKTSIYLNISNGNQLELIKKIESTIDDLNRVAPFEGLHQNQKYLFDNLSLKLDSTYIIVQPEVNKIADELKVKNLLVEKYLEKSNVSFLISLVALGLTLIFSALQFWQNIQSMKVLKEKFKNLDLGSSGIDQ